MNTGKQFMVQSSYSDHFNVFHIVMLSWMMTKTHLCEYIIDDHTAPHSNLCPVLVQIPSAQLINAYLIETIHFKFSLPLKNLWQGNI